MEVHTLQKGTWKIQGPCVNVPASLEASLEPMCNLPNVPEKLGDGEIEMIYKLLQVRLHQTR